jgi:hypothetical protein
VIGKVAARISKLSHGLPDQLRTLDDGLLRSQQTIESGEHLIALEVVTRLEYPDKLENGCDAEERRVIERESVHEAVRAKCLRRLVLHELTHDRIGVEPDHRREDARRAIAAFIRSIVTALEGLGNRPFKSRTEPFAATTS